MSSAVAPAPVISRCCLDCGKDKAITEFQSNGVPSHAGIGKWKPRCHPCHAAWKATRPWNPRRAQGEAKAGQKLGAGEGSNEVLA